MTALARGRMAVPLAAGEATAAAAPRRMSPELREQQIVAKAIEHFTRHGFAGSTRELARQLGVTQPLLYRYFPSKQALIDRVYAEVFTWHGEWEKHLFDTSVPLRERLYRFYTDYATVQLREEWVRIFVWAGLARDGINDRYVHRMRSRIYVPLAAQLWRECGLPEPRSAAQQEAAVEIVWGLHASIFYLGMRKWIFGLKTPRDINRLVRLKVDVFLAGAPAVMAQLAAQQAPAAPSPPQRGTRPSRSKNQNKEQTP